MRGGTQHTTQASAPVGVAIILTGNIMEHASNDGNNDASLFEAAAGGDVHEIAAQVRRISVMGTLYTSSDFSFPRGAIRFAFTLQRSFRMISKSIAIKF